MFRLVLVLVNSWALAASAVPVPTSSTFAKIAQQSEQLGYRGSDVLACFTKNNRLVVGGLSFWNNPLQIYLVESDGSIQITHRVSEDKHANRYRFEDARGFEVFLGLGRTSVESSTRVLEYPEAHLGVGSAELPPLPITCFKWLSGLEKAPTHLGDSNL